MLRDQYKSQATVGYRPNLRWVGPMKCTSSTLSDRNEVVDMPPAIW